MEDGAFKVCSPLHNPVQDGHVVPCFQGAVAEGQVRNCPGPAGATLGQGSDGRSSCVLLGLRRVKYIFRHLLPCE